MKSFILIKKSSVQVGVFPTSLRGYLLWGIFCVGLFLSSPVFAIETLENTGLVPTNIWYSKDPFYSGDRIRIHSVVYNGSNKDLRGRINFYNNKSLLCTSDFSSLSGGVSEVWCDWSVSAGRNVISIKIVNPKASSPGETEQDVVLVNSELAVSERIIGSAPKVKTEVIVSSDKVAIVDKSPGIGIFEKIINFMTPSDIESLTVRNSESNIVEKVKDFLVSSPSKSSTNKVAKSASGTSSDIGSGHSSNLASLYPAFTNFKDGLTSFFAPIKDWILLRFKTSPTSGGPLAYIMLFFHTLVKFIFESPIILSLLLVYIVWRIAKLFFLRNNDEY